MIFFDIRYKSDIFMFCYWFVVVVVVFWGDFCSKN